MRWDLPLRLLGGLHYLVLTGRASWDDVPEALVEEAEFLRAYVVEQEVQTNEVRRSWVLAPCFLLLAAGSGVEANTRKLSGGKAAVNTVAAASP